MTTEGLTKSARDLAARCSELQQLRKQVAEAEKLKQVVLLPLIVDASSAELLRTSPLVES
jgi:hypothetical protein